jgi:hypothetical protein
LNGDGKLDLVVSDYNTGVDVLLGNGDNTFQARNNLQRCGVFRLLGSGRRREWGRKA